MYEHGAKKSSGAGKTAAADRRNADRHSFTASAEVVELGSGARFSTRTTDLGPGGCFVDTMLPFPVGAKVKVTVRKGDTHLETGGLVVYSQTGLGMGIAFDSMEARQREALDRWLTELTGSKQMPTSAAISSVRTYQMPPASPGQTQTPAAVTRLVRLLITKGLITEAEGASVLFDPVL
ncbi:MAG TPA: PilZ domain-containing protein [Verrucomicrobiae bacterium]|nr:PilZ domain-containing protein [Verrucomicrobiae bacterium]